MIITRNNNSNNEDDDGDSDFFKTKIGYVEKHITAIHNQLAMIV